MNNKNLRTKVAKILCITTLFSFGLQSNFAILAGKERGQVNYSQEEYIGNLSATTGPGISVDSNKEATVKEETISELPEFEVIEERVDTDFEDFNHNMEQGNTNAPAPWGFLGIGKNEENKVLENNIIDVDYGKDRGKIAEFITSTGGNVGLIRYMNTDENPAAEGRVLVEGKFKFQDMNTVRRLFLMNSSFPHLALAANKDGTMTLNKEEVFTYELNTWYHIQMIIDNDLGEMDLFVNGKKQGDKHPMVTGGKIEHLRFIQMGEVGTSSSMYVDDLKILEITPDDTENPDMPPIEEGNILDNGGFEDLVESTNWHSDMQPKGWGTWIPTGNPKFEVVDDDVYEGKHAIRISTDSAGRGSATGPDVPVVSGRKYIVNAKVKTEETDRSGAKAQARIRVTPLDENKKAGAYVESALMSGIEDWKSVSIEYPVSSTTKYLRIGLFMENSTGARVWYDDVSVKAFVPVTDFTLVADGKFVLGKTTSITPKVEPANASDDFNWYTSDETIATVVDGKVTGVGIGKATITAKWAYDESIQASMDIEVEINPEDYVKATGVKFSSEEIEIAEREFGQLKWSILPEDATIQRVTFEVENPEVAIVQENGEIIGLKVGQTKVTARTQDGEHEDTCTINVVEAVEDKFDIMREDWKKSLLGIPYDENDSKVKGILKDVNDLTKKQWEAMENSDDRTFLWEDLRETDKDVPTNKATSAHVRSMYVRLLNMTKAYSLPGSDYYQDQDLLKDISDALDFLYENHYYAGKVAYSNWWNWEIGVPVDLNNIIVMLYDDLSPIQIKNYTDAIEYFQPDPTKSGVNGAGTTSPTIREAVGANRVDVSKVVAIRGVIVKDAEKIAASRDALSQVFEYVDTMDGFYKDGSFLQHANIAYTGSYGHVLINGVATLLDFLHGTSWEVEDPNVENMYKAVIDSFEPVLYKGAIMDMVSGRAISRPVGDHGRGHGILDAIITLIPSAPEEYSYYFKSLVKDMIEEDTFKSYLEDTNNMDTYRKALEILNDESIKERKDYIKHVQFPSMDRVVHHQKDYAFGIAGHSNRVGNFEAMNNENTKGWYTGDGMTFLYNTDLGQYTHYWPTVNPYRMPGTTEDTGERDDNSGQRRFPNREGGMSSKTWVGGAALDTQGAWGMDFESWDQTLEAKKSWFMFDKEIVALGADINSEKSDVNVETTVENRKLYEDGDSIIRAGNNELEKVVTGEETLNNTYWAHLESYLEGSDIGYYFPKKEKINLVKETRQGKYTDINYTGSDELIENDFFTLWINHGEKPESETYEYVLLPNLTVEETKDYSNNPEILVLSNTEKVQAVKNTRLNTLAANFWTDTTQSINGLTSHNKASVIMEKKGNNLEISVSDPTMKNKDTIELEVEGKASEVISKDSRISVEQLDSSIKITVNVKDSVGQSYRLLLALEEPETEEPEQEEPEQDDSSQPSYGRDEDSEEEITEEDIKDENLSDKKGSVVINKNNISTKSKNGTTKVTVEKESIAKAINQAFKEAKSGTRPQIVISVADTSDKNLDIEMPTDNIKQAIEGKVDIAIKSKNIHYKLPFEALANIELKEGETIEFSSKELASKEVKGTKDNDKVHKVIDFNLLLKSNSGSRKITKFNKPIEIKINIEGLGDSNKLGIYYIDEDKDTIELVSNKVENGFIIMETDHYSKYAVIEAGNQPTDSNFPDILTHWARESIELVIKEGIASGYPDGSFKPNNSITRAEFVAMINSLLELETEVYDNEFKDVDAKNWFADSVATAKKNGIIGGYPDGTFKPNDNITRAEMMSVISSIIEDTEVSDDEVDIILAKFTDNSEIDGWAKKSIAKVVKAGIIGGIDSKIEAKAKTTRAEAATVIERIINNK